MAKPKPQNNPEYTKILFEIIKGNNTHKILAKKDDKAKKNRKDPGWGKNENSRSAFSMKMRNLKDLGIIESDQTFFQSGSTTKYFINYPGIINKFIKSSFMPWLNKEIASLGVYTFVEEYLHSIAQTGYYKDKSIHEVFESLIMALGRYKDQTFSQEIRSGQKTNMLEEKNTLLKDKDANYFIMEGCWVYYKNKIENPLNTTALFLARHN
jgi:DNA-binding transcriptional regulator GbsR (MarR family)